MPAVSIRSFQPTGTPPAGPGRRPAAIRASTAAASRSARSSVTSQTVDPERRQRGERVSSDARPSTSRAVTLARRGRCSAMRQAHRTGASRATTARTGSRLRRQRPPLGQVGAQPPEQRGELEGVAAVAAADDHAVHHIEDEVPVGRHRVHAGLRVQRARVDAGEHPPHVLGEPAGRSSSTGRSERSGSNGSGRAAVLADLVAHAGRDQAVPKRAVRERRGRPATGGRRAPPAKYATCSIRGGSGRSTSRPEPGAGARRRRRRPRAQRGSSTVPALADVEARGAAPAARGRPGPPRPRRAQRPPGKRASGKSRCGLGRLEPLVRLAAPRPAQRRAARRPAPYSTSPFCSSRPGSRRRHSSIARSASRT